jgi:type III restriction enzyme
MPTTAEKNSPLYFALQMNQDFNPILNNPYDEPTRYFDTSGDGRLNATEIKSGRRPFVPSFSAVPLTGRPQQDLYHVEELAQNAEQHTINLLRKEVRAWRESGYAGSITRVTKELLQHWFLNEQRIITKTFFFAQREAIETAIWLNELAPFSNVGTEILRRLKENNARDLPQEMVLPRIAFKMATGTGKTTVMALLVLYHFFNRREYRNDKLFADNFLLIAPNITIKDRLRGLIPNDDTSVNGEDDYRRRDMVPPHLRQYLPTLSNKLVIINRHKLERRNIQGNKVSPLDGKAGQKPEERKESYASLIKREFGKFKPKSRLLVINDEAHHCYFPKENDTRAGKEEAAENTRAATWYRGILALQSRFELHSVCDLSATPYYLSGSGYPANKLFPWVVTEFGLVEAIEAGLVKIPFMPDFDDSLNIKASAFLNLYDDQATRDALGKISKGKAQPFARPVLPPLVVNALKQMYEHYEEQEKAIGSLFTTPPVMIIVCPNTKVSAEVAKYVAGFQLEDDTTVPGRLEMFSNFDHQYGAKQRPPTLLIDSEALDEAGAIDENFKKVFSRELEEFKNAYRVRYPEKSVENLTDADILREVLNTVGKPNTLGQYIRCVISVGMLTEGWDANTVTHIVGIRAFGSQLLCEQVIGRALRRLSYNLSEIKEQNPDDKRKKLTTTRFAPEYAHIIGVPFDFMPAGKTPPPVPPPKTTTIFPVRERAEQFQLFFPNVEGYRLEQQPSEILADFSSVPKFLLNSADLPTKVEMRTAFSNELQDRLELKDFRDCREQELLYALTADVLEKKFNNETHYFGQLKPIVQEWLDTCVDLQGNAFKNMLFLYLQSGSTKVSEHIYRAIQRGTNSDHIKRPILNHYKEIESTADVFGVTLRETYAPRKSHTNLIVADTGLWEQQAAKVFDIADEVQSYAKNAFLNFAIPYVADDGETHKYYPDYLTLCKTPSGKMLNLIVEISGMNQDKVAKKHYVEEYWLPSVNNVRHTYSNTIQHEWSFLEITNPQTMQTALSQHLARFS